MVRHFVLTLTTGTPKRLSDVLGAAEDSQMAGLWLQPRSTNAGAVYIGTDNTITSTSYGVRIPAASAGEPPAPFSLGDFSRGGTGHGSKSPIKLSELWALGTSGDFLHILALYY